MHLYSCEDIYDMSLYAHNRYMYVDLQQLNFYLATVAPGF